MATMKSSFSVPPPLQPASKQTHKRVVWIPHQNKTKHKYLSPPHRCLFSFIDLFFFCSLHCSHHQLVQLSKAQDVEAGDGTTSVVVIAGSLLSACERLLSKGIHPSEISNAFGLAAAKSAEILESVCFPSLLLPLLFPNLLSLMTVPNFSLAPAFS